jgi:hypothetical protein
MTTKAPAAQPQSLTQIIYCWQSQQLTPGDLLIVKDNELIGVVQPAPARPAPAFSEKKPVTPAKRARAAAPQAPLEKLVPLEKLKDLLLEKGPLSTGQILNHLKICGMENRQKAGIFIRNMVHAKVLVVCPSDRKRQKLYSLPVPPAANGATQHGIYPNT